MNGRVRFARSIGAVVVAALLLGACAELQKEKRPVCPQVLVLKDAGGLSRYKPGPGRDITDLRFEARLVDFRGDCGYDDNRADMNLKIMFEITRGPAQQGAVARFSYFVAIPKFHPSPAGKRVFPVAVSFPANRTRIRYADELEVEIPLDPGPLKLDDYKVYLGFQLSPGELDFNRRNAAGRR